VQGPEPCVLSREGPDEASAGERSAPALIRARKHNPGRRPRLTSSHRGEDHTTRRAIASDGTARRGPRPHACMEAPCTETGKISPSTTGRRAVWSASGRHGAIADDIRDEKSDRSVVPATSPNKAEPLGGRRGWTEGAWSRERTGGPTRSAPCAELVMSRPVAWSGAVAAWVAQTPSFGNAK
jgi:hypothetical protein